ncbi:hypothetical protein acdb102_29090 [Acidothermaceae bacterium B102]|nr:hypothetical protein acdb102_29090 [Acidothermaceae bacterium B102]
MRSAVALALVAALVPAPSPLAGNARSQAAAAHRVQVILDRVHVPGGVPETLLGQTEFAFNSPFPLPVERQRAWVVPAGREALIHAFRVHPPRGFAVIGRTIHLPALGGQGAQTIVFLLPADRPQSQMQQLSLSARDLGSGKVELFAGATVAWIPPRSKAEAVPAVVTGAQLEWYPEGSAALQRRAVKAADAVRLAHALNAMPPTHQLTVLECPSNPAGFAFLTLLSPSHVRVYDIPLAGCPFVTVTVDGDRQPDLAASPRLRSLVTRLMR